MAKYCKKNLKKCMFLFNLIPQKMGEYKLKDANINTIGNEKKEEEKHIYVEFCLQVA